jgi:hypothetical protein
VFHAFQAFPPGEPAFITAARAQGYRTVSVFPDQLTTSAGSRAGFDDDRSGPLGWRQLVLPIVLDNSVLVPILKPALPEWWPSLSAWNQSGTFTYDVRREVRGILRAGSSSGRTLVAAHLTYPHLSAYPASGDLSWDELWTIARAPASTVRDRTFDWQDIDRASDPLKLHAWKLAHVYRVIADEMDAAGSLDGGRRVIVFSDHGSRAGLQAETFADARYYHVPLVTFGVTAQCPSDPISLIDIGRLLGFSEARSPAAVEFTIAPLHRWSAMVQSAQLRWTGEVELDRGILAEVFTDLKRHDPWPEVVQQGCAPAVSGR